MSQPAARITDMHTCPMLTPGVPPIPHVGGPIASGAPTVLIGGLMAARVTDFCTCVGPPDAIAIGSLGVVVGGLCAARIGDQTMHGGAIVAGLPTVLIGDVGNAAQLLARAINPSASMMNSGFNVDAAIARLYGTDPGATSSSGPGGTFTHIEARHGTLMTWGHNLNKAFNAVRDGGPGTTAIIGIDYGNGSSHVVTMTNYYGTPIVIEGQNCEPGRGAGVISDPAAAEARYSPVDVGIAVLPKRAPH
jgi:uncharacterized Zn-binding protein involved in type VI secretion